MMTTTLPLTSLQKRLLNDYQRNFPLSPTPYADIAEQLGVSEAVVLQTLQDFSGQGIISRIGPVFTPHRIGCSTLATIAVPPARLEEIASYINSLPEVNHNYEREHQFNLWFVITATTPTHLQTVLAEIEKVTGLAVMSLPLQEDYHIDLAFNLQWSKEC
jgi:DNA-binding Lrp family transcriptional regulator